MLEQLITLTRHLFHPSNLHVTTVFTIVCHSSLSVYVQLTTTV